MTLSLMRLFPKIRTSILTLFSLPFTLGTLLLAPATSHAGVFNLPNFIEVGSWAIGIEPEITLTSGAGLAGTAKFNYGLNELSNLQLSVGHGNGPRAFRAGAALTFDFIPDVDQQPGLGLAVQSLYVNTRSAPQVELTAIPYIHKEFDTGAGFVDPFVSIPVGFSFEVGHNENNYRTIANVAVGASFRTNDTFRYTVELGLAINNMDSYITGGVTYRH